MRKTHTEIHLRNEPEHGHKEYKYLYQQMLKDDVIRKAYKKLRKGKTKRKEIQYIDAHLDNEVQKMYDMILNTKPEGVDVPHPELAYKPKKRTPKIIFEHGKRRKIYMPEIHEQWLHHIIVLVLEPIITATAYPYSCGSFPKRGAHYQVCKFYYEKGKRKIGRALDFMGFIFYRTKTLIRKNIMLSATRLAKKMERSKEANRGYFHRHIEAMLSYMGWFTCTDTYDCYQSRIKPYIHVGRLKKIISKIKRRQNHEGMDQGKMLRGAAGAAACG